MFHLIFCDSCGSVLLNTPICLKQANKVVVLDHSHAQIRVVLHPLAFANSLNAVAHKVKAHQKVTNNFLLGQLLFHEVLVLTYIVGVKNLLSRYTSFGSLVNFAPGSANNGLAALGKRIAHTFNKVFVTDHTLAFFRWESFAESL